LLFHTKHHTTIRLSFSNTCFCLVQHSIYAAWHISVLLLSFFFQRASAIQRVSTSGASTWASFCRSQTEPANSKSVFDLPCLSLSLSSSSSYCCCCCVVTALYFHDRISLFLSFALSPSRSLLRCLSFALSPSLSLGVCVCVVCGVCGCAGVRVPFSARRRHGLGRRSPLQQELKAPPVHVNGSQRANLCRFGGLQRKVKLAHLNDKPVRGLQLLSLDRQPIKSRQLSQPINST